MEREKLVLRVQLLPLVLPFAMAHAALIALATLVVAVAATAPAAKLTTPMIVPSLSAHRATPQLPPGVPKEKHPLPYPNNDEHAWVSQMHALQNEIEQHDETLEHLNRNMQSAREHKAKLHAAQKLMHALVSLHQAESVLNIIDSRTDGLKEKMKKLKSDIEDLLREQAELRRQMKDGLAGDTEKLEDLRKTLAAKSALLDRLAGKRDEVAGVVDEWRAHVDGLRATGGLPPRVGGNGLAIPSLPKPPSSADMPSAADKGDEEEEEEEEAEAAPAKGHLKPEFVTATNDELAATQAELDHVVNVHIPKLQGGTRHIIAAAQSFIEAAEKRLGGQ